MSRLRVILVEPRESGNVGAVARAMKNFGLHELWIVGAQPDKASNALWWSSGAEDVLSAARNAVTLQEALADVHLSVATTSSRGRVLDEPLEPVDVAQLRAGMSGEQTLALVFGREDHGLTSEEAMLCQYIAVVPTSAEFPTMNLAQAVAVFAYELQGVRGTRRRDVHSAEELVALELVEQGLVERLHERTTALLLEVGYLQEKDPHRIYDEYRALLGRARMTPRETQLLLSLVKQIEWKITSK